MVTPAPSACPRCGRSVDDPTARFCSVCGVALSSAGADDPLIGKLVLGRYVVLRPLAQGGMGRVYLGEQRIGAAARRVAIKALSASVTRDPTLLQRFQREAATVLELSHPNTVRLYDFGEQDGHAYLVMEYVDGRRLAEVLARAPLPLPIVASVVAQVAGSLDEAHRRGVIHRDLKPENVMLVDAGGASPVVKVLDFGVAKHVDPGREHPAITARGALVGTPAYMSPEQFAGLPVDARSDVYALGLLAYQMLAGALPWTAGNVYEWAQRHVREAPAPLEARAPGLPPRVYAAVARALSKLQSERQATAGEFARELSGEASLAWAAVVGGGAASPARGAEASADGGAGAGARRPAPTEAIPRAPGVSLAELARRAPRRPGAAWPVLGGLFVFAVALGFGVVAVVARRPPAPPLVQRRDASARADASASEVAPRAVPDADAAAAQADAAAPDAPSHPNWPRASRVILDGLARARANDLDGALRAIESAQDLIGPTSVKLEPLRDAAARLGARAVRASLSRRRCAEAQALARRLRRAGAERDLHAAFDARCPAP